MSDKSNAILDAFRFRYACKKFDPSRVIPARDFDAILEAARLSPTSFGFEPWKMIVLRDEELKRKLYPIAWGAQNSLNGASHLVILLARKKIDTIYDSAYIGHVMKDVHHMPDDAIEGVRRAFRHFEEHDFNLLESDRALFDWACKQSYIVLSNMLTTAAYMGIDSCPIEGFDQRAVDALLAGEHLFDPEHFGVSVMAGFGYRAQEPRHEKTRQPLSDLVIWR